LEDVASVLRGNARSAVIFSKDIMTYLKDCKACLRKDWEELKKILGIYPLGLRTTEITLLKFLADRPMGTSLTSLAAKLGMNTDVLRKDIELQLQAYNLMDIQAGKGRVLTVKGYEYLRGLPNLCL
jgi:Holliday junction resolvasome RuvABC ATP-dependent DNA helicase subunit